MRVETGSDKKNKSLVFNRLFLIGNLIVLIMGVLLVFGLPDDIGKTGATFSPKEWIDFSSSTGGFKIHLPSYPTESLNYGENPVTSYVGTSSDGTVYSISFSDAPFNDNVSDSDMHLKDAVDIEAAMSGGTILGLSFKTFRGYPVVDGTIRISTGYLKQRSVLVGRRMYSLVIKSHDKDVKKFDEFYNSFELIK